MTHRIRRVVLVLSWACFLILTPPLLLYALGHRITPSSPLPAPVGAFLIRTFPRDATVSVNGQMHSSKTPTAIRSLAPGTHTLQLEKTGYRPWGKQLEVYGTRVTDLRHVRLIPTTLEEEIIRENVIDAFLSPHERWLAVIETAPRSAQLRIVPTEDPASSGTAPALRFDAQDHLTMLWSPNEEYGVFSIGEGSGRRHVIVDVRSGRMSKISSATEVLGWGDDRPGSIVARSGGIVKLLSPLDGGEERIISQNAVAAAKTNRGVIVVEENARTKQEPSLAIRHLSISGSTIETFPLPPIGDEGIETLSLSSLGDVALLTSQKRRLLLWDAQQSVWRAIREHVERIEWSPEGEKLLWQESEFDIWTMNLREKRTVLPSYAPELVTRLSAPVRHITWFAGSQHILFQDGDIFKLVEIDGRGGHRTEPLFNVEGGSGMARVAKDGTMLFAAVRRENRPVLLRLFLRTREDR